MRFQPVVALATAFFVTACGELPTSDDLPGPSQAPPETPDDPQPDPPGPDQPQEPADPPAGPADPPPEDDEPPVVDDGDDGTDEPTPEPPGPEPHRCNEPFPESIRLAAQGVLEAYPAVPGFVVSLYHEDFGQVSAGFGVRSWASSEPMPAEALFDVGSVHKVFKWVLLEQQAEAGALSFDDPISKYVSQPTIVGGTIGHLTNHSTGMVDIGSNFIQAVLDGYFAGATPQSFSYDEMMEFLRGSSGSNGGFLPDFSLGQQHNYSSFGPVIAAEVVSRLTGDPPQTLIQRDIIDALGLTNTHIIGPDAPPAGIVQGHGSDEVDDAAEPYGPLPTELLQAVSSGHRHTLYSSACDMLAFARAISDPELGFLEKETIESRLADPIDVYGYYDVGRGLFNYHGFGAGEFWTHGGDGMSGHSSMVGYNPSTGVVAAIHANLRPSYIENDYQLHWDVLAAINAAMP